MIRLSRLLLIPLLAISTSISTEIRNEELLQQLEETLKEIDTLEGYGSYRALNGLEYYLDHMQMLCEQNDLSQDEGSLLEALVTKLFSRYAYKDGSYRSRIYGKAQQKAHALLQSSERGKLILTKLSDELPLIEAYSTLLR